eukprot:TRINITY_DN1396_c0_g1_i1.p1 TRINITY_DN1396_c0_g1~~TRINITY_DN1396_c0_g1_i1.p1  ORF type:complete len:425 (-),score=120.13 TRINITY_DN1396_c0_g1_i1:49-1323(-)
MNSAECMHLESTYGAHNYHPLPVVFDRAEGVFVYDPEGKRYYDFLSAYSAVNQGHCHPKIVQALTEQAQKLTLSSRAFYNSRLGEYCKYITEYFDYEMVLPMNSGVEAVETACKVARKWGYEKKGIPHNEAIIICCENNFHGRTISVISMSTDPDCYDGFGPFVPGIVKIPYNDIEALEKVLKEHGEKVAGFLFEPIQGEAGIMVPDEDYCNNVQELCKKYNVLMIADEVQTGIARTGTLLAHQHNGAKADVVILGKALSGGVYPVSAVLSSKEIMLCIKAGEHGSTFGGNPLACAVAMAALEVVKEENLVEKAGHMGEIVRSKLREVQETHPFITAVRGRGLLNAVDIAPMESGCVAWHLCLLLKEHGLLCKPTHDHTIRLACPLTITEEQMDECLKIFVECCDKIITLTPEYFKGWDPLGDH